MRRFKIGTFNVYNLVLPDVLYYNEKKYSRKMYNKKLTWIGHQISTMDAEILGFQEVFHQQALQEALLQSSLKGATLIVEGETGEKPVVGLATTFEVLEHHSFRAIPEAAKLHLGNVDVGITEFSRPVLKVKLAVTDFEMVVFVAHLKSKRPEFLEGEDAEDFIHKALAQVRALIRRGVEAAGLRALVLEEIARTTIPTVVLGDLNDAGEAVTTQVVSGEPPWKFEKFEKKQQIWDRLLYSAFEQLSKRSLKKSDYTYIHNGHYEILDHILVSQEFYKKNPDRLGEIEYVHVFNDHLIDGILSTEPVPKWQSDHGQVVATIRLK